MVITCWLFVLTSYPAFYLMAAWPSLAACIIAVGWLQFVKAGYSGVLPSLLSEQFPVETRAIGVSLGFSTAVSIFGGLAPLVATWLIAATGDSLSPSYYLIFTALLSLWFHERRTRRMLEDVSGRLRRSEAHTHTLLRHSSDIVAVVAGDATIKYLSPAAEQIVGRAATAYVGASFASLVHPEDLEQVTEALAAPAAGDAGRRVEFRVRHHDGQWLLLEATIHDHRDDPAVEGLVVLCRDVGASRHVEAELREAHERFRSTFENAPIGMALITVDGRFVRANRALARMVGRAEDELAGTPVLALTHREDHAAIGDAVRRVLAGDASPASSCGSCTSTDCPSGSRRPCRWSATRTAARATSSARSKT